MLGRRKKRRERRDPRERNIQNGINGESGSVVNYTDSGSNVRHVRHDTRRRKKKPEKMRIEMRQAPKRRKRRRSSTNNSVAFEVIYKLLLSAAILCAVVFMCTVFFEIKDIDIEGNEKYSSTEIIAASEIEEGDKLLFINRFDAESKALEKLPYISEIKIKRRPPSKLLIEVMESEAKACLQYRGMSYLIDENCKLLEFYPTDDRITGLPIIKCSEVASTSAGKEIEFVETYMLGALKDVIKYVIDDEISIHVTDLSIEKLYDINFMYDGRLKVVLGESTDIEKKILYFKTVLKDIDDDDSGTVNVKNPERTIFRPSTAGGDK